MTGNSARAEDAPSHGDDQRLRMINQRLELLGEVASRLLASESPAAIVQDLADSVMRFLECHVFFNYLLDEPSGRLHLNAHAGISPEQARAIQWLEKGVAVCGCVAAEGVRRVMERVQDRPDPLTDMVRGFGVRAYACHPIRSGGKTIGTLSFGTRSRDSFSAEDVALMKAVTDHIAIAMDRLLAQEALRKSEEQLRLALTVGNAGTWDWNMETGELAWNDAHYRLMGLEPGTPVTIDAFRSALHPADRERVVAEGVAAAERHEEFHSDYRIVRPNGAVRWLSGRGRFFHDAQQRPVRMVGVLMDMTAVQTARESAEAASRAKDHFLAVLSHELRTPLTPILTNAQLLEREPGLDADAREMAGVIQRNAELEARLIDDLLDLTRIARGALQLNFESVALGEVLDHVIAICDADLRSGRLRLELEVPPDLPRLRADPARLQQILWNVVKNAVKFTGAGGTIRVGAAAHDGNSVQLFVSDSGVGIAPQHLPNIFDAFDQGDPGISRIRGGLGLGLAICRGLVDLHGGTIVAESEGVGRGATLRITLPVDHGVAPDRAAHPEHAPRAHCRILLVEDHADTRKAMARVLKASGYQVRVADGVGSALRVAEAETFDVLISDIGLPDGTGLDLMRQLSRGRNIRGIALSGYGMDEDLRRSSEAGFAAHLTKPVSIQHLQATIARLVDAQSD